MDRITIKSPELNSLRFTMISHIIPFFVPLNHHSIFMSQAATAIQRILRGFLVRLCIRRHQAAVVIQANRRMLSVSWGNLRYALVMTFTVCELENGPQKQLIYVDLPVKDCDFPVRRLLVYQRVSINGGFLKGKIIHNYLRNGETCFVLENHL